MLTASQLIKLTRPTVWQYSNTYFLYVIFITCLHHYYGSRNTFKYFKWYLLPLKFRLLTTLQRFCTGIDTLKSMYPDTSWEWGLMGAATSCLQVVNLNIIIMQIDCLEFLRCERGVQLRVEESWSHAMQQLDNISMSDRSRWTAHHKALPERSVTKLARCLCFQLHTLYHWISKTFWLLRDNAYFLGSLIIHQLLTSLKG